MQRLKSWALREDRGVMILRGARQVGKTTLVRMLAKELQVTLIEINMEESQSFTNLLKFKEKARDILELIMLEKGVNLAAEEVLFFFDEAQEVDGFYQYLRYFKEKAPDYKIIAAGSLFEFEINQSDRSQGPTGRVEYSYLEPMSFEEYLLAVNPLIYNKLLEIDVFQPVEKALHEIFLTQFKEYLVCGGMPAAVAAKADNAGPIRLDEIKMDILTGYFEDLPKYAQLAGVKLQPELLKQLMQAIYAAPSKGMKYSHLAPGYKAREVKKHLDMLTLARIIRRSYHTGQNKVPLILGENTKNYKLYALDLGLCYSFMNLHPADIFSASEINDVAHGAIAEQYVAQTLMSMPPFYRKKTLNHWQRQKRGATSEVDFILAIAGKVIPIECKAGKSNKLKSLRVLLSEKEYPLSLRVYIGRGEVSNWQIETINGNQYDCKLLSIPHYLLERFCCSIETC